MATPNITDQYFRTLFDEFNTVPKAKLEAFIGIASDRVSLPVWGETRGMYATALLTAHMLTMTGKKGQGAAGGPLTSESVGDLARGFGTVGVPGSGDQELLTTRYGQEYVALRRATIPTAMATGPTTIMPPQVPPFNSGFGFF